MRVSLKIDIDEALKSLDMVREESGKAIPRALNKTAITARAQAAREIVGVGYGIKIAAIKKAIAIRKASPSELTASVIAGGKPIPLINYGARQTKDGVSVAVLTGRKVIKHAFIATVKSGHKGVFIRTNMREGPATNKKGFEIIRRSARKVDRHGLPIDELFGPGVPSAFANSVVQDALARVIRERFGVVLKQELQFIKLSR